MLQSNGIMFGWNRPVVGREGMAAELFTRTVSYFEKQKSMGTIESWEPVFLANHGGDLNGYFLIRGTHAQLATMKSSDEWLELVMRASQCLTNVGTIEAYTGNTVQDLMTRWTKTIPSPTR